MIRCVVLAHKLLEELLLLRARIATLPFCLAMPVHRIEQLGIGQTEAGLVFEVGVDETTTAIVILWRVVPPSRQGMFVVKLGGVKLGGDENVKLGGVKLGGVELGGVNLGGESLEVRRVAHAHRQRHDELVAARAGGRFDPEVDDEAPHIARHAAQIERGARAAHDHLAHVRTRSAHTVV